METKNIRKVIAGSVAALTFFTLLRADDLITAVRENEFLKELKTRLDKISENYQEDRVYLQFDKPVYEPGNDIWFSAYVIDAASMKPSTKSDVVHIELLSPKGSVEHAYKLLVKNGKASGDFRISEDMPGGIYKVRAYTNWMKNEPGSKYFEKEIQVQDLVLPGLKMKLEFQRKTYAPGDEVTAKLELETNENQPMSNHGFQYRLSIDGQKALDSKSTTGNDGSTMITFSLPSKMKSSDALLNVMIDHEGKTESISRSVPVFRNDFKVELYPEGGDLVHSLSSRVAFKVTNEFGKPADISGIVVDESGRQVTSFTTFHNGFGAFNITPESGEKYSVKITKPEGCDNVFELPSVLPAGFVMQTDNSNPKEIGITIQSTETEEISIVGVVRGKIYYSNAVNVIPGTNRILLSSSAFPAGLARFTVFDDKGIERAERLVFVNKDKKLDITISTNKEKYLPREKVRMTITARDQKGMPMPSDLSVAVTNDQLISMANDKSGNIYSHLYLQPELNTPVEEASFYFDPKESKADKALDYLLMTAGWRRFSWEELSSGEMPDFSHRGEKAILAGRILDAYSGQPVKNAEVTLGKKMVASDENGTFIIKKADISENAGIKVNAQGYSQGVLNVNDYSENLTIYMYSHRAALEEGIMDEAVAQDFERAVPAAVNEMMMEGEPMKRLEQQKPRAAAGMLAKDPGKGVQPRNAAPMKAEKPADKFEQKMAINKEEKEIAVFEKKNMAGKRAKNAEMKPRADLAGNAQRGNVRLFYRARKFTEVTYSQENHDFNREDFRTTVYWNGDVHIDKTGSTTIEFYNCDEISSFRITAEGIGSGLVGHCEKTIFTQLPFSMNVKLPVEVVTEDQLSIPLTLVNNTTKDISGALKITTPMGFKSSYIIPATQVIAAGSSKTIYLDYTVEHKTGEGDFTVYFTGAGHTDSFTKKIKTVSKGFPVVASFSGNEMEKEYEINVRNYVPGSMQGSLSAYPSVLSDLMKGVESILREPSGCFEQTSMSSYPNVMVMDYLKTTGNKDEKLMASAEKLLERGYAKLTSYEAKEKGYEWFGASPAHEALTAYGLMQFNDMKEVYGGVDQKMIDRTAAWLMDRKDGNGGFLRNGRALDNFGAASEDITNAYIIYALSEAGYKDLKKEYSRSLDKALSTNDPYQLALMANASFHLGEQKNGLKCIEKLCKQQSNDGSFNGTTHSVTRSTGNSLKIETSALAVLAMLKSQQPEQECIQRTVKYLVGSRSGYGAFGSTQGTILALKALTAYAKFSKATAEPGIIAFYVDGKRVAERAYKAGEKESIEIRELEKFLSEGKHTIKVKFENCKASLPFSVGISWNTFLPESSKECSLDIDISTATRSVKAGETLRLSARILNKNNEGLASPIAIIGIPAGFTFQPWQLKELSDKKMFDYYEVKGNSLIIYYRQFAPSEKKTINLDLKAELPGVYEAPASSTYLYYTNEFKTWKLYDKITVRKS